MCRIRVLERLHPGPLARVKCERPGQRLLAHRRTESGAPHASFLTLLPPSAGEAAPARPSPAHLSPPPTLPPGPASAPPRPPLRPHCSGQRHSPGSRNSPRLGQRLTHWRTLMKPSGSSSRLQRSPTSRRSTCGDRARGQGGGGPRKALALFLPLTPGREGRIRVGPTPRWRRGGERAPAACREYLLARRLVRRATGALRRGHAGAAGPGRGARSTGTAVGLGAADPRRGKRAVPKRERPLAARDPVWLGGSRGRCCLRSPRPRPPLYPAGCRKPPSPIQTSVKLANELGNRVTWRALENPPPAPLAPGSLPAGCLKGTCGLCGQFDREGAQVPCQEPPGPVPSETSQLPRPVAKVGNQPGALAIIGS